MSKFELLIYELLIVIDELWELIEQCWDKDPEKRPTFDLVLSRLERFNDSQADSNVSRISLYDQFDSLSYQPISNLFKH